MSGYNIDYYKVLGLSHNATYKEIRKQYLRLVKQYHPDKGGGYDADHIKLINEAYRILSDEKERFIYDIRYYEHIKSKKRRNIFLITGIIFIIFIGFLSINSFYKTGRGNNAKIILKNKKESFISIDNIKSENLNNSIDIRQRIKLEEPYRIRLYKKIYSKEGSIISIKIALKYEKNKILSFNNIRHTAIKTSVYLPPKISMSPKGHSKTYYLKLYNGDMLISNFELEIISRFLNKYVKSYVNGDIVTFVSLFDNKAFHNGKPFADNIIRLYNNIFSFQKKCVYKIQINKVLKKSPSYFIISGNYHIIRLLKNGSNVSMSGTIEFLLKKLKENKLIIKSINFLDE